jgi:cysteine synthase A
VNIFAYSPLQNFYSTKKIGLRSALDLIGNTPLLDLTENVNKAKLYAKAEFQNPSGSIKDRMVLHVIEQAELRGELKQGQTIVEATSGNTGVSLAMIAAIKGYKAVIVAPDSTSDVKKNIVQLYGAELLLTDSAEGINSTVEKARVVASDRGAYLLNQFKNPDNPKAHHVTGKEILNQAGFVDVFVAGVGTGGTLVGVGDVLKGENPDTCIVAVEPLTAPALYNLFYGKELSIGLGIPHSIEGIGETFVPEILLGNLDLIDDVVLVEDRDAFSAAFRLARGYGYCVGISSGANMYVTNRVSEGLNKDNIVVTVFPDSGQRYLGQMI